MAVPHKSVSHKFYSRKEEIAWVQHLIYLKSQAELCRGRSTRHLHRLSRTCVIPILCRTKKREINIKVQFVQDSYGGQCNCQVSVSTKLAQALPVKTMFLTDRNLETGEIYANEYGAQVPGQQSFEDVGITTEDGKSVDPDTGEIHEDHPVVDFRNRKKA